MNKRLQAEFYQGGRVTNIAKALLGQKLCTHIGEYLTSGIISEVEAYAGINDRACHANNGVRTRMTEVMYAEGGVAYVYLCYGIHHMFNVVTNAEDKADAILIRAIEPVDGLEVMLQRRNKMKLDKTLTCGPGNLGMALGLNHKIHNAQSLQGPLIWIEETNLKIPSKKIIKTTRIGVDYAEEDALKPWRFYIKDSKWISKK